MAALRSIVRALAVRLTASAASWLCWSVIIAMGTLLSAQPTPDRKEASAFEVASIRQSDSDDPNSYTGFSPEGTFTAKNATLRGIFQEAYRVTDDRIKGGPKWFDTERYNITAKPSRKVSREEAIEMLKALLADRFKLVVSREMKEVNGFVLLVANGGYKIRLNTENPCVRPCGGTSSYPSGRLSSRGVPISRFVTRLSEILGRPVLDSTALLGSYDIDLEWAPEASQFGGTAREVPDDKRPSIFSAIQEQLGLRLESKRIPLEILIIASVQRPSEN